jgi:hypothetical protein
MKATIELQAYLQRFADNKTMVTVNGNTINECLSDLVKQYPNIKNMLFDLHNELHPYVSAFVNNEMIYKKNFDNQIKDGEAFRLLYFWEGG